MYILCKNKYIKTTLKTKYYDLMKGASECIVKYYHSITTLENFSSKCFILYFTYAFIYSTSSSFDFQLTVTSIDDVATVCACAIQ